ncbi:MAG TPA: branched-chain amino acid aminotransferase [Microbacteriaceae bacterium]|nr:branched-chain amino acid aminotransferase [Microbacteriaceae bacterium]
MTITDPGTQPATFALTRNPHPTPEARRSAILADPGFGNYFTDHMVSVTWTPETGWANAAVTPYGPLQLDPAAAVLHYAQEIFEGMKAYRHADGSIHTFRPEANAARFRRSAHRLALPEMPEDLFVRSLKELIAVDGAWVPDAPEMSLYLRPFMFAEEAFLGVRPAKRVAYHLIASPAGAYFAGGVEAVKIWLSTDYARAGKGGTGAAKTGGNYAASLLPQAEAYAEGCAQVVFLDSVEEKYLEELGGMNIVVVYKDGTLATPKSESILAGITRESVLQLAVDEGHPVEERRIAIDELKEGIASGEVTELFACGTAAIVTPISELKAKDFSLTPVKPEGDLSLRLRAKLTDIQYGRAADTHQWLTRLDA